jgi:ribonuclease Z
MLPPEPPRRPQMGFVYAPPFRVQGISIAGEATTIQIPELGVTFDIGDTPKAVLTSDFVALSHGHMDHAAGLAYYFSQRSFQGLKPGTVVCHPLLEEPIHNVMKAWIDIENQRTPYNVVPLEPEQEIEIKNNLFLRAFKTVHTESSLGYVVIEKRSKLLPELVGLPQEKILERKNKGEPITQTLEVPQVCFTGDTAWGVHFEREDILTAKVLITECTFLEPGHRPRASVGKHLHLDDVVRICRRSKAEAIILTHLSRRTHMKEARKQINLALKDVGLGRVHVLMDSRTNRARYQKQQEDMAKREASQEEK